MKHEMVEHLPRHGASEGQAALDAASCPVAVDLAVFTLAGRELSVLLSQRREAPYPGFWALPGGLHRPGTSLDDQARSLHQGITGLEAGWIEQSTEQAGQVGAGSKDTGADQKSQSQISDDGDSSLAVATGQTVDQHARGADRGQASLRARERP